MALGLGLIIGINLPINFKSPYKSLNIVDFWRAWHISLSFFFRDLASENAIGLWRRNEEDTVLQGLK